MSVFRHFVWARASARGAHGALWTINSCFGCTCSDWLNLASGRLALRSRFAPPPGPLPYSGLSQTYRTRRRSSRCSNRLRLLRDFARTALPRSRARRTRPILSAAVDGRTGLQGVSLESAASVVRPSRVSSRITFALNSMCVNLFGSEARQNGSCSHHHCSRCEREGA